MTRSPLLISQSSGLLHGNRISILDEGEEDAFQGVGREEGAVALAAETVVERIARRQDGHQRCDNSAARRLAAVTRKGRRSSRHELFAYAVIGVTLQSQYSVNGIALLG
jgi:hypothetical protein